MTRTLAIRARLGIAGLAVFGWAAAAHGQGNTFNPYGNSGYADYREFTTPMYSNDPALPGQARLEAGMYGGVRRANQFEQFTQSLDNVNADTLNSNRGVRTGLPYYQSYQLFDKSKKRTYKPNETADREFLERLNKRDEDYQKAQAEKDPAKRAVLMQRIERNAVVQAPRGATAKSGAATPRTKAVKPPSSSVRALDPPAARRPAAAPPRPATTAPAPEPAAIPTPAAIVNPSAVPIPAPG